jgi:hypothetical protein
MDMSGRYVIKLSVYDKQGHDEFHMATDSDEFPVFSERFVDDIRDPGPIPALTGMSFDTVVRALKKREFRREYLMAAAKKLAERLAEYIDDKEGWHGERRRELIKDAERR